MLNGREFGQEKIRLQLVFGKKIKSLQFATDILDALVHTRSRLTNAE